MTSRRFIIEYELDMLKKKQQQDKRVTQQRLRDRSARPLSPSLSLTHSTSAANGAGPRFTAAPQAQAHVQPQAQARPLSSTAPLQSPQQEQESRRPADVSVVGEDNAGLPAETAAVPKRRVVLSPLQTRPRSGVQHLVADFDNIHPLHAPAQGAVGSMSEAGSGSNTGFMFNKGQRSERDKNEALIDSKVRAFKAVRRQSAAHLREMIEKFEGSTELPSSSPKNAWAADEPAEELASTSHSSKRNPRTGSPVFANSPVVVPQAFVSKALVRESDTVSYASYHTYGP